MKNLFKNLMLVAVAAMTFTACEKSGETTKESTEGATFTFDVNFDDTRSGFDQMNGDNEFPSYWEGTENMTAYGANYNEVYYEYASNVGVEVNLENNKYAQISVTMPRDYYTGNTVDYLNVFHIASPAESISGINYSAGASVDWTKLMEQTPRENNVDAKAHVVYAKVQDVKIYNIASLTFEHLVAYAKMNITALPDGVTSYDKIEVTLDSNTYTLNTNYRENIWFAVKEATPTTATITIVSGEDKYKKDLNLEGATKFTFANGKVTGFNVDMSTAEKVDAGSEPEFTGIQITSVTPNGSTGDGDPYYRFKDESGNSDFTLLFYYPGIKAGNYTWTSSVTYIQPTTFALNTAKSYKFDGVSRKLSGGTITIDVNGDIYTIIMNLTRNDGEELSYYYQGTI